MVHTFITQDDSGLHAYTGHVVCRGPSTIVVLLTEPYTVAGHTVSFPISSVLSERVVVA
ncbi:MAG: hypothetical protein ACRDVM_08080 [Acidimicrobiia bacterium]